MADASSSPTTKRVTQTVNESLFRPSEWDDYPMKRDDKHTNKIIQPDFSPLHDATKPEQLPQGFLFGTLSVSDDADMQRLVAFLNANFDGVFQVDVKYVRWVLDVPSVGSKTKNIVTVTTAEGRLIGVVCSRPVVYRIDGRVVSTLEAGWLCTLRDLRSKRLASVLMKELYRRAHVTQAGAKEIGMLFAMKRQLPGLSLLGPTKIMRRSLLKDTEPTKNIDLIRFANLRDVSRMMKIYRGYRDRWRLYREYTRREFEHTFLRRGDVMTYVTRTDRGDIKDFISVCTLSTGQAVPIPGASSPTTTKVAYVHFVSYLNEKLLVLFVQNVLHILSKNGFTDVYIEDVGGVGDVLRAKLQFEDVLSQWYYQFNYNTKRLELGQSGMSNPFLA